MEMTLPEVIAYLDAQQKASERVTAVLLMWLVLLTAAASTLTWAWVTAAPFPLRDVQPTLSSAWAIGAFLGLSGCAGLLALLWRLAHTATRSMQSAALSAQLNAMNR